MNLLTHMLSFVPTWFAILLALAVVVAVWRYFGKTPAALATLVAGAVIAYLAGRKNERAGTAQMEQKHADEIQTRGDAARAAVERAPDSELRDDDGFRRD